MNNLYEYDNAIRSDFPVLRGADEAGRGPLCGPVCCAAVVLPADFVCDDINDSKKISEKKRDKLFDIIIENALAYSIEMVSAQEIDQINILNASLTGMKRAVLNLGITPDMVLVDGNKTPKEMPCETRAVVKGDATSMSIAAASILAKVTRDRMCEDMDREYPQYGIAKHKGYGTKEHMNALREFGPSPIHRKKFIRFLDEEKP